MCYPRLRILDAETLGLKLEDKEPPMNALEVIRAVAKAAPSIEGDEGLTYMTEEKGLTVRALIQELLKDKRDIKGEGKKTEGGALKATRRVICTNNIFLNTRNTNQETQRIVLKKKNCKMFEYRTCLALWIRTLKIYDICLFPGTWTATSNKKDGVYCINVGFSSPEILKVYDCNSNMKEKGSAGQWEC